MLGRKGQRGESCEGEEEDFDKRLWNTCQLLRLVDSSIPNNILRRPTSFSSPWGKGEVCRKRVPHADVAFYPCNINRDLSWHFYQEWGDKITLFWYSYLIAWIFQHKQKAQSILFLRSTPVKLLQIFLISIHTCCLRSQLQNCNCCRKETSFIRASRKHPEKK